MTVLVFSLGNGVTEAVATAVGGRGRPFYLVLVNEKK